MGDLRIVRTVKDGGWSLWSIIWKQLRSFELMSSHKPRLRGLGPQHSHLATEWG